MINEQVKDYTENFYGFGDFDSDIYIIGMEEGGTELEHRINIWKKFKSPHLLDTYEMHKDMPSINGTLYSNYYDKEKWQPSISPIIKGIIIPILNYNVAKKESWREFQAYHFGRVNLNNGYKTCAMELYPLPCRNEKTWLYTNIVNMNKDEFRKCIVKKRVKSIKGFIHHHHPKFVLFYGGLTNPDFNKYWDKIAGSEVWDEQVVKVSGKSFYSHKGDKTIFVKMLHPICAVKNRNQYYDKIVSFINMKSVSS